MADPFGEVSAMPVVVPIGIALLAVLLWRLHVRRLFSVPRAAVAVALSVYAAGILANTVFPIFLDKPDTGEAWSPAVALIPFYDYELADALMNMAVFVPLGLIVPLLLARPSWGRVLATVAGASAAIELTQLAAQAFFSGGHIADVNDLLSNVAGGALGYSLFLLFSRVPVLSRLIDRFRWARSPDGPRVAAGAD